MPRYSRLIGLALTVIVLDQVAKALVVHALPSGGLALFGGAIHLDYVRNSGAAFGVYRTGGLTFAVIAVLVSAGILVYFRRLARSPLAVRFGLGLIEGGALGNLIDRVRLGYVVDFIDLRWWPVFNVADSAIVVGVALLLIQSLLPGQPPRQ